MISEADRELLLGTKNAPKLVSKCSVTQYLFLNSLLWVGYKRFTCYAEWSKVIWFQNVQSTDFNNHCTLMCGFSIGNNYNRKNYS